MILRALRNVWAVVTSMRTALLLLFAWAVAAAPGSIFPQRNLNPEKVAEYYVEHPRLAPIVDRLWGFDVFAAPWFAAIYVLLFVSLLGCLASRIPAYFRSLISGPARVPSRLDRLPDHADVGTHPGEPAALADALVSRWRKAGWHAVVRREGDVATISAERGRLREAGNLLFHSSLVVVLIGVALGGLYGYSGGMIVVEGQEVCNSRQSYDQFTPGRLVDAEDLPPFCLVLEDFRGEFTMEGQPLAYTADGEYATGADAVANSSADEFRLEVNEPLRLDGASIYLLNHGYAPIVRYADRHGTTFETPTPFLPKDEKLTSEGAVLLPEANQDPASTEITQDVQVAFEGVYVPTVPIVGAELQSAHPQRRDEGLVLVAYRGDTGLNVGIPRSVYTIDQKQVASGKLVPVGTAFLRPGETWTMDDGSTVEFVGTREWMAVSVAHDPGKPFALVGAVGMILGLCVTLFVRRRRAFARLVPVDSGTSVTVATLARGGSARSDCEKVIALSRLAFGKSQGAETSQESETAND